MNKPLDFRKDWNGRLRDRRTRGGRMISKMSTHAILHLQNIVTPHRIVHCSLAALSQQLKAPTHPRSKRMSPCIRASVRWHPIATTRFGRRMLLLSRLQLGHFVGQVLMASSLDKCYQICRSGAAWMSCGGALGAAAMTLTRTNSVAAQCADLPRRRTRFDRLEPTHCLLHQVQHSQQVQDIGDTSWKFQVPRAAQL